MTCTLCHKLLPADCFAPRRRQCRACLNANRNRRRQTNGFRDYMRDYMRRYRAANPERELAGILRRLSGRDILLTQHPAACSPLVLEAMAASDLPPDEALMLAEETAAGIAI